MKERELTTDLWFYVNWGVLWLDIRYMILLNLKKVRYNLSFCYTRRLWWVYSLEIWFGRWEFRCNLSFYYTHRYEKEGKVTRVCNLWSFINYPPDVSNNNKCASRHLGLLPRGNLLYSTVPVKRESLQDDSYFFQLCSCHVSIWDVMSCQPFMVCQAFRLSCVLWDFRARWVPLRNQRLARWFYLSRVNLMLGIPSI